MNKKSFWTNAGFVSLLSSLICIVIGMAVGFLVLLALGGSKAYTDGFRQILLGGFYMDTQLVGEASAILGAGRQKKEDAIDYAAGIILKKKTGDFVRAGEPIAVLRTNTPSSLAESERMLIIGCALAQMKLSRVFSNWRLYVLAAIKMIAIPIAAFYSLRPFLHDQLLLGIAVTMLCMPSATNTTIISYEYGGDGELASSGIFLTTLLSIASIPALMYLLFR